MYCSSKVHLTLAFLCPLKTPEEEQLSFSKFYRKFINAMASLQRTSLKHTTFHVTAQLAVNFNLEFYFDTEKDIKNHPKKKTN